MFAMFWIYLVLYLCRLSYIESQVQNPVPLADDVTFGNEIPGVAGIDYPIYNSVPTTRFACNSVTYPGYYADVDTRCQAFHICDRGGRDFKFLCPNGTLFSQETLVCDWWFHVNCQDSLKHQDVNRKIFEEMNAANRKLGIPTVGLRDNIRAGTGSGSPGSFGPGQEGNNFPSADFGNQNRFPSGGPFQSSSPSPFGTKKTQTQGPGQIGNSYNEGGPFNNGINGPQSLGPFSQTGSQGGLGRPFQGGSQNGQGRPFNGPGGSGSFSPSEGKPFPDGSRFPQEGSTPSLEQTGRPTFGPFTGSRFPQGGQTGRPISGSFTGNQFPQGVQSVRPTSPPFLGSPFSQGGQTSQAGGEGRPTSRPFAGNPYSQGGQTPFGSQFPKPGQSESESFGGPSDNSNFDPFGSGQSPQGGVFGGTSPRPPGENQYSTNKPSFGGQYPQSGSLGSNPYGGSGGSQYPEGNQYGGASPTSVNRPIGRPSVGSGYPQGDQSNNGDSGRPFSSGQFPQTGTRPSERPFTSNQPTTAGGEKPIFSTTQNPFSEPYDRPNQYGPLGDVSSPFDEPYRPNQGGSSTPNPQLGGLDGAASPNRPSNFGNGYPSGRPIGNNANGYQYDKPKKPFDESPDYPYNKPDRTYLPVFK